MPTPHSDRHARLTTEASDTTHRSNPAVQADGNESGVFLNIPKPSSGSLTHDTHTRSRSVDEMESTSTPFYFGQGKSSDFVTTGLNSHSRANPMTFPSISLIQAEDATTSSLRVTGEEKSHHNDVFCFGNNSGKDTAQPVFSFGFLHNYTPLPSPRASPAAQVTDASYRDPTSSQGSSPLATGSTAGIHLSPPRLSLNQSSSSSTPDITDRLSSLSLAATSTTSIALSTSSENPPDETANNHGHITGSESSPEPYDPREEPGPEHEYFTSTFQQKLRDGASIAKDVVAAIEKLRVTVKLDGELEQLLKEAKEMTSLKSETTRKIAILGDSGEGKSSLINSLLHFPGIAQTGDIGSACTSVVTEYRHKEKRHKAPITIEVEYLSSDSIEDLLRELLWSYRQLYLPLVESDETSEKDYAKFQAESEHAWSALSAAFGHQQHFRKDALRDMSDGASERALDQLLRWSREIEWPTGGEGGSWMSTATTADECCEKTKIFMQDKLWPFTKIIRVYLSSQVLKTGVVLADLPGLQDTNLARVRATQDYLMQCDNVFIVAKIARAITNNSVKSSMYWALSRHAPLEWEESAGKNLNVSLVCTRSEDIDFKTAKRDLCGPGKRIPSEVVARLEADVENAKRSQDRHRKKELKRVLEFLLISARNDHVKEGVRQAYSSEIPNGKLDIFCVSNTVYEKYCRKGIREYINASGIVELRNFCHGITAEAQLREAQHYLHSSLGSLLNSLGLWAGSRLPDLDGPGIASTASIKTSLQAAKEKAQQSVSHFRQDFIESFDELITSILTSREPHWDESAQVEARLWETASQYNAWCLRNGNHYTEKRGAVDWNAKLIWRMRMELDYNWGVVIDEVKVVFKKLRESVADGLNSLKSQIAESPKSPALGSLADSVDTVITSWNYKLELAEEKFARRVEALRRRSSESHSNSYILNEMIPSYRSASVERGTGKAARQRAIVGGKVAEGSIFPNISIRLSTEMCELVEETAQGLHQLVAGFIQKLEEDMAMALRLSKHESGAKSKKCVRDIKDFQRDIDRLKERRDTLDTA